MSVCSFPMKYLSMQRVRFKPDSFYTKNFLELKWIFELILLLHTTANFIDEQIESWKVKGLAQSHTANLFYKNHECIWDVTYRQCGSFICPFIHTPWKYELITSFMPVTLLNAILYSLIFLALNAFLHPH